MNYTTDATTIHIGGEPVTLYIIEGEGATINLPGCRLSGLSMAELNRLGKELHQMELAMIDMGFHLAE